MSVSVLRRIHPFHGITFLACKQFGLPIGTTTSVQMDQLTRSFLQTYHRLDPDSEWFYQPYKSSDSSKRWVISDYASSGLQAINTQTFRDAFIHPTRSREWGWSENYLDVLALLLAQRKKIPLFDLAVWVYRDKEWVNGISIKTVQSTFVNEFRISAEEQSRLFDTVSDNAVIEAESFQISKLTSVELRTLLGAAPDAEPDQGGTLAYLRTSNLGPATNLELEPARRLNLITGDNGLGKTFLLECAWWALTGTWPDHPAYPVQRDESVETQITFAIQGENSIEERRTIKFDWRKLLWPQPKHRPTIPGLIVYARVDGSFAVWDPAKRYATSASLEIGKVEAMSSEEVWDGSARIE